MSAVGTILFIVQGVMRAKPEMKPWGHAYEKEDELRKSGTNSTSAGVLALGGECRPFGAQQMCFNN